jgi:type II secretory pathway pseudopilin PulG
MKSVKCSECGFVGWADAERCKKCGVVRLPDPAGDSYQTSQTYEGYQPSYRANSHGQLKKGLAVASLVVGILSLFTFGILGIGAITGIVLAVVALGKAKRNPYEYGGQGLATAGLVTSILSVVIIVPMGIVAAIAIPNLLASRRAANEGASIATLRKIDAAEQTYQAVHQEFGTLDELGAADLIDHELASGERFGYRFKIEITPGYTAESGVSYTSAYHAVGIPLTYGSSGLRSFYVDDSGVIRGEDRRGAEATELTPPLNAYGYSSTSPPSRYESRSDY